ncbi:MAG: type II toxin-antitoxin system Phd/YefM family antitoxin [Desulfobacterales bacterium]|nr:type II toxin-antitoxin system Phd/YefM family antitoxin [Desulfobacterales bacterium]
MEQWQLQDAKNKFSEVVEKALTVGPQIVTRRGVETVVVISVEQYRELTRPETNIADFFIKSPLRGSGIKLERDTGSAREVTF